MEAQSKKSRKKYSLDFKLNAICAAEKDGNRPAADKLKIPESIVREWRKNKEKFISLSESQPASKKFRLEGGGRKAKFSEIEEALKKEILARRNLRHSISCDWIMSRAADMFKDMVTNGDADQGGFQASRGWLQNFFERHGFSIRRRTSVSQKIPSDLIPKLIDFVIFVRKLTIKHSYLPHNIYACDETAVWFDMLAETTVDSVGVKHVPVKTTGHEKMRITVMLAAKSDGSKCKPFIIFKRKRPLPALEKMFPQLNIAYNSNGWMDDSLTMLFLRVTLGELAFERRLLVWDAFRCHISEQTKQYVKRIKADMAIIPAGCTSLIQPGDVSWNKPFKSALKRCHSQWLSDGSQEYTKAGNMKAASPETICNWIVSCWNGLSADMISKSFRSCGIGLANDGSEDFEINCFKNEQPCSSGFTSLVEKVKENFDNIALDIDNTNVVEDVEETVANTASEELVSDAESELF